MSKVRLSPALALLLACGPAIQLEEADTSGGSDEASDSGGSSLTNTSVGTSPGTSAGTSPGTSATTTSDTSGPSTATTDDTSTSTSTVGDSAETISFIDTADTGGPVTFECDLWADDCPEGEKCMPWANDGGGSWNATRCSPLDDNPRQPGESCTVEGSGVSGIDNCAQHSMCFNVDPETNMGTCIAMCEGSEANPTCADECSECSLSGDGVLILCLPTCDPLLADACGDGFACLPVDDAFACVIDASGDVGAIGDACEFLNVCDPGLFCAEAEWVPGCEDATGCCTSFCDADAAFDPCEALLPGSVCTPWFEEPPEPDGCTTSTVGVCLAP